MRQNYGSGQVAHHIPEKKKIQVVLRNYDNTITHQNGINSFAIGRGEYNGSPVTNLFTASRDRLIKLWSVDYTKIN